MGLQVMGVLLEAEEEFGWDGVAMRSTLTFSRKALTSTVSQGQWH